MTATLAAPAVIRFNLSRDEQCHRCAAAIARGERGGFPAGGGPLFLCPACCEALEAGEPLEPRPIGEATCDQHGPHGGTVDCPTCQYGAVAEHLAAAADAIEAREALERGEPADPAAAALVAGTRDPRHKVVRFQHGGPMGLLPAQPCAAGCGVTLEPEARGGRIGGVNGTACDACCDRFERGEPLACESTATDAVASAERSSGAAASSLSHSDAGPAADKTPPVAEPAGPATGVTPDGRCTCTDRRDGFTNAAAAGEPPRYVHARCGLSAADVVEWRKQVAAEYDVPTDFVVTPAEPGAPVPEVGDVAGVTKLEEGGEDGRTGRSRTDSRPVETPRPDAGATPAVPGVAVGAAGGESHPSGPTGLQPAAPQDAHGTDAAAARPGDGAVGGGPVVEPVTPQQRAAAEVDEWVATGPKRSEQAAVATLAEQGLVAAPPVPVAAAEPAEASGDETPLDLRGWMSDAKHWGADPKTTLAELVDAVRRGILAGDLRGRQVEIGPSEVGHPCPRWLAYRLAGTPPTGTEPTPWRQRVGTLIHADVDDHAHADNVERGTRWLTNLRVTIGELYPGRPIRGTLDVFDVLTGTVIDVKGLAVDTPIPTPSGWSTMGQLAVGDQVFGADGVPCTVMAKSEVHWDRSCYRVTFNDRSSVVTDNVHQWRFLADRTGNGDRHVVELSTEQAAEQVVHPVTKQRHLRVLNPAPLDLPDLDLPIHPYVLGAWLGDGDRTCGRMSLSRGDLELFDHIADCGYQLSADQEITAPTCVRRNIVGLAKALRIEGLIGDKRVPERYLRGSIGQRLALLQGLMDTDGTWNRKRNQATFNNLDKPMIYAVAELVRSLGWKATINEYTGSGFGKRFTAYSVTFVPHGLNPFRLRRKADLVRLAGSARSRTRVVQSIEPVPVQATQCIQVDAADSMFLCGVEMIPTHNCPGATAMKTYGPGKPESEQYRVQLQGYGRGVMLAGFLPAWVATLRLSPARELSEYVGKPEKFDAGIAERALARAGGIARMVDQLGERAPALLPMVQANCHRCQWLRRDSTDPATGCPGAPGTRADYGSRRRTSVDDLVG